MTPAQASALNYYTNVKQLTKDVAIGIVSVLQIESGLNPLSENNSGTDAGGVINPKGAYGLAQWNGARQTALQAFATREGLDVSKPETQLWFVLTEAADSFPATWTAFTSPASSYASVIEAMVKNYERPADQTSEVTKAMAVAKQLYGDFTPSTPVPTPTPTPSTPVVQSDKATLLIQVIAAIAQVFEANNI